MSNFYRGEILTAVELNGEFSLRVARSGDTMTGPLTLAGDPVAAFDAATKQYVDRYVSSGFKAVATIGPAPTASAWAPLWWDTISGQLFVQYDDGSSIQWVVTNAGTTGPAGPAGAQGIAGATGATGATGPQGVPGTPATSRNTARLQAQWVTGAVVTNDTVWFAYDVPYNGTINSMTYFTGNGSFSVAVQINSVNVTGLNAIAVNSSSPTTTNATAANIFTAGQRITAVITAATGSPTDALLSLAVTWS